MYLIHVRLAAPDGAAPPDDLRDLLLDRLRPGGPIDHVSISRDGTVPPTVGMFVTAPSLVESERIARAAAVRAIAAEPRLRPLTVAHCGAALVGAHFEQLLAGPSGGGRSLPRQDQDSSGS
ncbi:hypothetical protein [Kitasatospora sp. NPDC007106]|uniref:hypothetical protein n=1 Tax=Kitasatospora sp. NPDC007106 TaxID=3156914 RepID=UPI0033C49A9B